MLSIRGKLIVGVITILIMAFGTSIIYTWRDFSGLSWTIWGFILYMSPVVLIFGTITSMCSDLFIRKIFRGENFWLSLLLHAIFAFLIMLGFIFYNSYAVGRSFTDQFRMANSAVLFGVIVGVFYAIVNYLFKKNNWFTFH